MSGLLPQRKAPARSPSGRRRPARLRATEAADLPLPADHPRLREATVDQLVKLGGERLLGQLVELFASSAPERIAAMQAASVDGGAEAAERAAHTLKASAGNLGAMRMWALCQGIESAAAAGRFDDHYVDHVRRLTHEYAIVEPRLRARLGELR